MNNKNKKEKKFYFVKPDEVEKFSWEIEKDLEKSEKANEEIPNSETKEEFIIDDSDTAKTSSNTKNNINRPYFGFEARVIAMLIMILLLFSSACFMILKAVNYSKDEIVTYSEASSVKYKVCLNNNNMYEESCLEEGMQYVSSLVHDITASFRYNVNFSSDIAYDLGYHVVALTQIYDKKDTTKVLYKKEEILVEKTMITDKSNVLNFNTQANINYNEFNKIIEDYKKNYNIDSTANVQIILYLDEKKETRNVASVTIPLGEQTFNIKKNNVSNTNQSVKIIMDHWNQKTILCTVIATGLVLISMIFLYKLAYLVWKVTSNHNKYQAKVSQILREYDRIIVVARDGYESNITKKVIKVASFDELLDARETLEKPIIYSKINSVKSEFIVEDDKKLYKYVLKESDL